MVYVIQLAINKPVWHTPLLCVQWKTPVDRQRNCPKHVEFYSKNKFEKLLHLVGFIIRSVYFVRVQLLNIYIYIYIYIYMCGLCTFLPVFCCWMLNDDSYAETCAMHNTTRSERCDLTGNSESEDVRTYASARQLSIFWTKGVHMLHNLYLRSILCG